MAVAARWLVGVTENCRTCTKHHHTVAVPCLLVGDFATALVFAEFRYVLFTRFSTWNFPFFTAIAWLFGLCFCLRFYFLLSDFANTPKCAQNKWRINAAAVQ